MYEEKFQEVLLDQLKLIVGVQQHLLSDVTRLESGQQGLKVGIEDLKTG